MSEHKLVINDVKAGKSYQKVVDTDVLINKKIGEKVPGDSFGFTGYEFEVRGGSDSAGFPMRKEVDGAGRKSLMLKKGSGFNPRKRKPQHTQRHYFLMKKKTVRGNTISPNITQVNLKVLKYGKKKLNELLGKKEETPKETPAEKPKPKEEKKEAAPKAEEKPAEAPKKEEKKE